MIREQRLAGARFDFGSADKEIADALLRSRVSDRRDHRRCTRFRRYCRRFGRDRTGPVLPVPHFPGDLARGGSHPPNLTLPPALAGGKLVFERQGVELSSPPLSSCGLTLCCLALPDALGYACAHPPRVARQPHPGQESICT
ncbi:hypothetical protein EMEDMD4_50085 [Sinorhizobium medicae]|uniref:Uncharacterized protein n=1 Tax=Sinorhizobium medicae TaxID=110321 RepID=A0A508X0R4_9HYPH|nr:hypothetical protein EMEDMD4_50085 [Sinorhizobium medicae]